MVGSPLKVEVSPSLKRILICTKLSGRYLRIGPVITVTTEHLFLNPL